MASGQQLPGPRAHFQGGVGGIPGTGLTAGELEPARCNSPAVDRDARRA